MAVVLVINAKDGVGDVLKEVLRDLDAAAKSADKVTAAGKRMGQQMKESADDAKKASEATKSAEDRATQRITALSSTMTAVTQVGERLFRVMGDAADKVEEFANRGDPAFVRMNTSIKSLESAWNDFIRAVGSAGASGAGKGGSVFEGFLGGIEFVLDKLHGTSAEVREEMEGLRRSKETLQAIDNAIAQQAKANALTQIQSLTEVQQQIEHQRQLIEELGRTSNMTDAQRAENAQKLVGLMQQEQALLKQRQQFERVLFDYEKSRIQEREDASLQQIKGMSDINRAIDEQITVVRELAETDGTTVEQMEEARRKLLKLDQRRKEVIREVADKEKKAAEESKRHADEVADEKRKAEERQREEIRKTAEESAKARQRRVDDIAQKAGSGQSLGDAKQQEVDLVKKTNEQILQLREQATQSYVSGDVKGFMQARQQEAQILQQAMQQQKEIREKFGKEGKSLDKIKAGISQEDIIKTIQQNSGQTRKQVMNDFKTGKRGEADVTKATNELVEQTINSAQEQGKLGEEQVAGLRQALQNEKQLTEQVRQQAEETKALNDSLREVQEELGTLRSDGRSRAMRR